MKAFCLFALTTLFTFSAYSANQILIQGSGTSLTEYKDALRANNNLQSYVDYKIQRIQANQGQEEQLFSLGDNLEGSVSESLNKIETLERSTALSATSLNFIRDLTEKLSAQQMSPLEKTRLQNLNCKAALLVQGSNSANCKNVKVDLGSLRKIFPTMDTLMIESAPYSLNDSAYPEIHSTSLYHWILLSNSSKPIEFFGTYRQFVQQRLTTISFTDGTCGGFNSQVDDFEAASRAVFFFGKECVKKEEPIKERTSFKEWVGNNKSWLIPVGAVLVGGAVYGTLKDKTIVIDKP